MFHNFTKKSERTNDQEKLAKFMVENGMLSEELAKQALYLGRKHSIGFDEAIVYLEKSNQLKQKKSTTGTSSKSNLSGSESSVLRRLVQNNLISTEDAALVVKESIDSQKSLVNILCQFEHLVESHELESDAVTLIINSNLIVDESKETKINFSGSKKFRPLVLLIAKGKISSLLEHAALESAFYVNEQEMTLQEAKLILRYVSENNVSFNQALKELGLSYSGTPVTADTSMEEVDLGKQIKQKLSNWSSMVCSKISYQS